MTFDDLWALIQKRDWAAVNEALQTSDPARHTTNQQLLILGWTAQEPALPNRTTYLLRTCALYADDEVRRMLADLVTSTSPGDGLWSALSTLVQPDGGRRAQWVCALGGDADPSAQRPKMRLTRQRALCRFDVDGGVAA